MDELELRELTLRFQEAIKQNIVEKFLQKEPKAILVIRLELGLSQFQFLQKVGNSFSQVSLIKHEKGRSKRISRKILDEIVKVSPSKINIKTIMENYRHFEKMKNGAYMTSERAKKLHKIWKNKTTINQWQEWGRLGAQKTNTGQRLTSQEKGIKQILDKLNLSYKIHHQVKTKLLDMNIDFVIFQNEMPKIFIEVTERKHDLSILCQAYAYRCRLLKEMYPESKFGIVIKQLPFSARKVIEKEFNFILNTNSIENLSEFL